jgi:hypothetical protein
VIAHASAFGDVDDPESEEEVAYSALHGPSELRFYNHVCLFYGADPGLRDELARALGLPDERAETCVEEYDLAARSWGAVFDRMDRLEDGVPIAFEPGPGRRSVLLNDLLAPEVTALNDGLTLPRRLLVEVADCDEANAFYDPETVTVTICTEFVPHLDALFDRL